MLLKHNFVTIRNSAARCRSESSAESANKVVPLRHFRTCFFPSLKDIWNLSVYTSSCTRAGVSMMQTCPQDLERGRPVVLRLTCLSIA